MTTKQRFYFRSFASGGESPDPAVFCPANGYILDEQPLPEYPIVITPPSEEEIVLFCENVFPFMVSFRTTQSSSGKSVITVYDDADNVVRTTTVNTNTQHTYYFSSDAALTDNFYIKIAPEISGRTILTFLVNTVSGYPPDWPIVGAIFNTPNLTSLASAFYQISALKRVDFISTLNYLTSFFRAFRETGITHFTFPASLPVCTRTDEMFYSSDIYFCDLNSCSMPVLTTMAYMYYNSLSLRALTFNPYIPLCTSFSYMFYNTGARTLILSPTFSTNTITFVLTYMTQLAKNLEILTLPDFPATYTLNGGSAFRDCIKLAIVTFRGYWNFSGAPTQIFTNSINILEMYFDKSLNQQVWAYGTSFAKVKVLELPDSYDNVALALTGLTSLLEIDSPDCVSTDQVNFSIYGFALSQINLPGIKVNKLTVGNALNVSGASYIEFDWANSVPSDAFTIDASVDETELNRIFTALPTVTGITLDARASTGYATCDKTIATAKGWTVL